MDMFTRKGVFHVKQACEGVSALACRWLGNTDNVRADIQRQTVLRLQLTDGAEIDVGGRCLLHRRDAISMTLGHSEFDDSFGVA